MKRRILLAVLIVGLAWSTGGCVSTGKYEIKEKEANDTAKSLQEMQQKYSKLTGENIVLKKEVDRLTSETRELGRKTVALENENVKLRGETVKKTEEVQKTSKTYEDMLEKMKSEISEGQVTISELKGKLTVKMVDAILFDSGKAEVKPEGLTVLKKVTDILKSVKDKAIRVEGYTDNVKITGALARKYPTNWELSAARATNVTRYLQQLGIDPSLLSSAAYGEYHPLAPNDTKEGKAKNRRIEIILIPKNGPEVGNI